MEIITEFWSSIQLFAENNTAMNTFLSLVIGLFAFIFAFPWRKTFSLLRGFGRYLAILFGSGRNRINNIRIESQLRKITKLKSKLELYQSIGESTHQLIIHLFEVVARFFFLLVFCSFLALLLSLQPQKDIVLLLIFVISVVILFVHVSSSMQTSLDLKKYERTVENINTEIQRLRNKVSEIENT